ncbi:diguanylate cyclase [Candidatus Saccharibacteria bacterium]|nr:diguanylate cyclase [Candidatus Saccharibacteria bacterium]
MEKDLTLKKELHKKDRRIQELEKLVTTDPLTGILNRRGFTELAEKFLAEVSFHQKSPDQRSHFIIDSLSVMFFDIDNFKKINDTHGHEVGDKILQFVSSLIAEKLRASDFIGRWGGEEIVVALVGAQEKDAYQKAEEIRRAVKSRVKIPNAPDLTITVSVGVAELKGDEGLEKLVKKADNAMYKAKTTGKDRVVKASAF